MVWTLSQKSDDALEIHDDAPIITYLQTCEILIGLTFKEQDCVVHKSKRFKSEGNSFLRFG